MRISLVVVLVAIGSSELASQSVPRLQYVLGSDGGTVFSEVRQAAHANGTLVVLTPPAPALHVRAPSGAWSEWGARGRGPGDVSDPVDLLWGPGGALVLDQSEHKLTAFSPAGRYVVTRSLGDVWANRVALVGADTLLHVFVPMTEMRAVLRLRGGQRDTVFRYEKTTESSKLHLTATGAPSYTVTKPFTAEVQFATVPRVGFATWMPADNTLRVHDVRGVVLKAIRPNPTPVRTTPADREEWLRTAIPESFMGRKVFEPIRAVARAQVAFPQVFPAVLQLMGSSTGDVWVRRTTAGSGELWERAGATESFRLPIGRTLLQIEGTTLVAAAKSDDGEPTVEVYSLVIPGSSD